jgi:hypothetical protein
MIHFPRLEYKERENRLKALRFAPMNAQKTRRLDPPPSALLSCFQLGKKARRKMNLSGLCPVLVRSLSGIVRCVQR